MMINERSNIFEKEITIKFCKDNNFWIRTYLTLIATSFYVPSLRDTIGDWIRHNDDKVLPSR
jgi:hypothetical protein